MFAEEVTKALLVDAVLESVAGGGGGSAMVSAGSAGGGGAARGGSKAKTSRSGGAAKGTIEKGRTSFLGRGEGGGGGGARVATYLDEAGVLRRECLWRGRGDHLLNSVQEHGHRAHRAGLPCLAA